MSDLKFSSGSEDDFELVHITPSPPETSPPESDSESDFTEVIGEQEAPVNSKITEPGVEQKVVVEKDFVQWEQTDNNAPRHGFWGASTASVTTGLLKNQNKDCLYTSLSPISIIEGIEELELDILANFEVRTLGDLAGFENSDLYYDACDMLPDLPLFCSRAQTLKQLYEDRFTSKPIQIPNNNYSSNHNHYNRSSNHYNYSPNHYNHYSSNYYNNYNHSPNNNHSSNSYFQLNTSPNNNN